MEAIKSFIANPPFVSVVKYEDPTSQEAQFIQPNPPANGSAFGPFTGREVGPYPYKIARWQTNGFLGMAFLTKEAMLTGQLSNAALAVGIYENSYWFFNQTMGQSRVLMQDVSSPAGRNQVASMVKVRLREFEPIMRLGIGDRPPGGIQWQDNLVNFANNNVGVISSGSIALDGDMPEITILRTPAGHFQTRPAGIAIEQIRYGYAMPPVAGLLPTTFDVRAHVIAPNEAWEPGRPYLPATNVAWEPERHYTIFSLETTNQPMPMKCFSLAEMASSNITTQNFVFTNNQYMEILRDGTLRPRFSSRAGPSRVLAPGTQDDPIR